MTEIRVKVERRQFPRYVVYRTCSIVVDGTSIDVTLLNVSKNGLALLGSGITVSLGERVEVVIDGVFPILAAVVVNVNLGRIGAKFDLDPTIESVWEEEFEQLIGGISPME
jgi:hypothetical protein